MPNTTQQIVLSIAGFDPSAGAGLLADVKTFEANGVYGFGVISAMTWQNDIEFDRVEWISVDKIISQIEVLLKRFEIKYIKIGLVENMEVLEQLIDFLTSRIKEPVIILDPILKASAGFTFHQGVQDKMIQLMSRLYCITPNIPEANWLFGEEDLQGKLELMSETVNILLKGGHSDETTSTDLLYMSDHTYGFSNDRLPHGAKHGSGCVLSAALLANLALGHSLPDAAENANTYTYKFLASSETLLGHHQKVNS